MVSIGSISAVASRLPRDELRDVEVWMLDVHRELPECRVRRFGDGATLRAAIARGELPDVVVLDGEPGIELCRTLRRSHDRLDLPIIVVSAQRSEAFVVAAFAAGSNDALDQCDAPAELLARVHAAARARRMYASLLDTSARLYTAERRARADAELASRMKDEFLAIVSHELRTPLNAVLGWASILQSRLEHDPDAAKPLEVIQRNARLQAKLIDDILDVSRIISGKIRLDVRELELDKVIDQALEAIRPAADAKRVTLGKHVPPELPRITGDPDRLQQVVWNLVSNAVKFTPSGGRVALAVRTEPHHVAIDVTDTGAGIPPEHLIAIFERFRQVDSSTTRSHSGLGLGLAIVRQLVEMHGGTVGARSAGPGRGATFTVRLATHGPAATDDSGVPSAGRRRHGTGAGVTSLAGVRVVVVDDEADSRSFTGAALRSAGAEVIECSNADEASAAVRSRRPHVLVSDISMPRRDGYSLIDEVRRLPPEGGGHTFAIAVTAHAREHDVARCLAAGFDRHLSKPIESAVLIQCVAGRAAAARGDVVE